MPKIQTKPVAKKTAPKAPKAKKVTEPKIRTPLELALDYYRPYGYSDEFIKQHVEKMASSGKTVTAQDLSLDPIDNVPVQDLLEVERRAALVEKRDPNSITEENVREVAKARRDGKYRPKVTINKETGEKVVKVAPPPEKVENSSGVEVGKLGERYLVFGQPATGIMRWMGQAGWTFEEARKAFTAVGIPEDAISESTIKIQVAAGKKGGDCGGRGPAPELTTEQAALLNKAAGRGIAKKAPKPKAKKS